MKAASLREQTAEELRQLCRETRKSLFDLRISRTMGEPTGQPQKARTLRRDLARVQTVMAERGIQE